MYMACHAPCMRQSTSYIICIRREFYFIEGTALNVLNSVRKGNSSIATFSLNNMANSVHDGWQGYVNTLPSLLKKRLKLLHAVATFALRVIMSVCILIHCRCKHEKWP